MAKQQDHSSERTKVYDDTAYPPEEKEHYRNTVQDSLSFLAAFPSLNVLNCLRVH